jgi:hypothetical protein
MTPRYQVRGYFADKYSLSGKPEEYVYIKKIGKSADLAIKAGYETYAELTSLKGYLVYNYTRIVVWDTKHDVALQEWLFDINYVTQDSAEKVLDGIIDNEYPAVQVAEGTYPTSTILKNVDPTVYYETLNALLTAQNSAII